GGTTATGDGGSVPGRGGTGTVGSPPTVCAPVEPMPGPAPSTAPKRAPTSGPFRGYPLAPPFVFPPPAPALPGPFSRCASFEVGYAKSLAYSPDGSLVALATSDGIVRLVDVASGQVEAVLPPPRSTIDFVAFDPTGSGILTVASGEREVTLWRP